mgnify:CR=1 FL=1
MNGKKALYMVTHEESLFENNMQKFISFFMILIVMNFNDKFMNLLYKNYIPFSI